MCMDSKSNNSASPLVPRDLSEFVLCVGFGLLLFAIEATRLPALQKVTAAESGDNSTSLVTLVTLLLLVLCCLVLRNRLGRIRPNAVFVMTCAVLLAAALTCMWGQGIVWGNQWLYYAASLVYRLTYILLFFCWFQRLSMQGFSSLSVTFAFSLFTLAAVNILVSFLEAEASVVVLALLPILSGLILSLNSASPKETCEDDAKEAREISACSPFGGIGLKRPLVILLLVCITLFSYALVFGYVHVYWIAYQDEGLISTLMQVFIAFGSAIAGLVVLLYLRYCHTVFSMTLYLLLAVLTTIFSLWLTALAYNQLIFLCLLLLNFSQKSVFFFIVVLPYFIQSRRSLSLRWAILYLSFEVGQLASSLVVANFSMETYSVFSTLAVVVLLICGALVLFRDTRDEEATFADVSQSMGSGSNELQNEHGNRFKKACLDLAQTEHLTEREAEALTLLAHGRTAGFIAEDMVISPATAKVYVRNIYAKLGVHTQQDLISLVEERFSEIKEEEREETEPGM